LSHLVVGHPKVGATVLDEHVPLFEAVFVQQNLEAFPCREFPFGVLLGDSRFSAAEARGFALPLELLDHVFHGVFLSAAPRSSVLGIPEGSGVARRIGLS